MDKNYNVYYSAEFFIKSLKIFGLASYNLDIKTRKLETKLRSYLEFSLSIPFWIVLLCLQWRTYKQKTLENMVDSNLLEQILQYQYLVQHFLAILAVVYNFSKRQHVQTFLMFVFNFDQKVDQLDWKFKVQHSRNRIPCFLFVTFVTLMIYPIATVYTDGYYKDLRNDQFLIFNFISYAAIYEFYLMLSMQFILSTYCIYTRLKALRQNIRFGVQIASLIVAKII